MLELIEDRESLAEVRGKINAGFAATDANIASISDLGGVSARSFVVASQANVTAAAETLPDGSVFDMAGLSYKLDTGATTGAFAPFNGAIPSGQIYFEHWGAVGDGVTDDADAQQAAIDYCGALGFGMLTGLAPVYGVEAVRVCDDAGRLGHLIMRNGVHLFGKFIIRRIGNANNSRGILWIEEASSGSIKGIEIDAAHYGQPAEVVTIHGIYKNRNLSGYVIDDVTVRDTSAYGIGLQDEDGVGATAYTKGCVVSNVRLLRTGNDGIDVKNNHAETGNNTYIDSLCDSWGNQAGIPANKIGFHLRGSEDTVSNLRAINPGINTGTGIKLDSIEPSPVTAEFSVVSGCFVDTTSQSDVNGITVRRNFVNVSGCSGNIGVGANGMVVEGSVQGAKIADVFFKGVSGASNGIITGTDVDNRITVSDSTMIGFETNYNIRSEDTHLSNCHSYESTTNGIAWAAGLTKGSVRGGSISVASGAKITDSSGILSVSDVAGFRNGVRLSQTFDVSSAGVKTLTFTHGLDVTPAISDCTASLGTATINDWTLHWGPLVQTATSTQVTVTVRVLAASASAGKTATVVLNINASKVSA